MVAEGVGLLARMILRVISRVQILIKLFQNLRSKERFAAFNRKTFILVP